jgi:hypothetical protein
MHYFFPNSKIAVVQVPSSKYSGSITEVDKLADEIGQYGNITAYSIQKEGNKTNIIFKLAETFDKFIPK